MRFGISRSRLAICTNLFRNASRARFIFGPKPSCLSFFGSKFAKEIRKKRADQHSNWQWHLDEVFVKINGERFYLWRAVDHVGEVLECFDTKRRYKATAKKFLIKAMRKYGSPRIITTDKLPSYSAAFREIGVVDRQLCGGRSNDRC